jgi:hypothetical protein
MEEEAEKDWSGNTNENTLNKFANNQGFAPAGEKEGGAQQPHKRLLYCVNVN